MSHIILNNDVGLNMNKVTISFWFRVPASAAAEVKGKTSGGFWSYRVVDGVVPLIAFGTPSLTSAIQELQGVAYEILYPGTPPENTETVYGYERGDQYLAAHPPSFIGVRVGGEDWDWDPPTLDVHIQTKDNDTGSGLGYYTTGAAYVLDDDADGYHVEWSYEDASEDIVRMYEYLGNSDMPASTTYAGHPAVEIDRWQHVLISWELIDHSSSNGVLHGASKMYCAINDVNVSGANLPAMNDPAMGMGPNDHAAYIPWSISGYEPREPQNAETHFSKIPCDMIAIPCFPEVGHTPTYASMEARDPIENVQIAELQIFTGVLLDTSDTVNRRAFIDDEGKPAPPSKAVELLGQKPDVLIHGSGNWTKGVNTGTTGKEEDTGRKIDQGQFEVHEKATVTKYKPNPSLYGDQGE